MPRETLPPDPPEAFDPPDPLPDPDPLVVVGGVQNRVSVVAPAGAVGCGFAACGKQVGDTPGVSANTGSSG